MDLLIPAEALGPTHRILDARPEAAYAEGHLPGALCADLDRDLSAAREPGFDPARGGRHPLPSREAWAARLGAWGIGPETPVVACDDASGANAAARLWWMLRASGHARVTVLDGGLQAAQAAGHRLTRERPEVAPAPPYPLAPGAWPEASLQEVAARVQDPAWKVLDVRAPERFRGEVEPLDPVAGHIPGALNLPYADNLREDGRFRSPGDLRARYRALLGDTPPERLIVHCGSGVTACHTLLALERAGLTGARLFVGSWSAWCRSGREIGRGEGGRP